MLSFFYCIDTRSIDLIANYNEQSTYASLQTATRLTEQNPTRNEKMEYSNIEKFNTKLSITISPICPHMMHFYLLFVCK